MKHFLSTLLLTFIVGVCSAQTEHMKFKGVPMEGTLQTFTSKLKAKGFTFEEIVLGRDASTISVRAITGKTSVPQVFIGGEYIGGSDDLEKYFA